MLKKSLLALGLLLSCMMAGAQSFPSDTTLARVLKSDVLLPLLIDSAIKNSPEIQRNQRNVKLFGENLQSTKKQIWNSIGLSTSYGYGNIGVLSMEKDQTSLAQVANFNNVKSSRYNVSVGVQVSVGSFLSRKNTTRAAELQMEMAEDEQANAELFVKQQVIRLYQDMKLAHAVVVAGSQFKQSAFILLDMAKKNFRDGQIQVEQFTKEQNEYVKANMEYQSQLNKLQTAFLLLEAYTGVQLARLIERIK